ncbi:MAG: GTPase ObgE [Pseudomonadota bacterium]
MKFQDKARIYIKSGAGGQGCVSFRREKFIEYGGPNGGDGGKGGNIIARCVANLNTLVDYKFQQHFKAGKGEHGMGSNCHGKSGKDKILLLPPGTQIFADDDETLLADLTTPDEEILLLRGGNGGWGNARFKSSTNQAPRQANPGQPAKEAYLRLKLKIIADCGIIGMPNAGKSTFLSVVSNAKPKVAGYPFTTLYPNLGVANITHAGFIFADIPGLIEGASEGKGLGDRFLGHVERTSVLLHLLDGTEDRVADHYLSIRHELERYSPALAAKKEIIALNKCDALTESDIEFKVRQLKHVSGQEPYIISAVARTGLEDVIHSLDKIISNEKSERIKISGQDHISHDYHADDKMIFVHPDTKKQGVVSEFTMDKMQYLYDQSEVSDMLSLQDTEEGVETECIYVRE